MVTMQICTIMQSDPKSLTKIGGNDQQLVITMSIYKLIKDLNREKSSRSKAILDNNF